MAITRVSTFALQQSFIKNMGKTQLEVANIQQKINTTRVAGQHQDIFDQIEAVNAAEKSLRETNTYVESNDLISQRLGEMSAAFSEMLKLFDSLKQTLVLADSAIKNQYPVFQREAESLKNQFIAFMNTNSEGRFLFSGSKTNVRPVSEPVDTSVGLETLEITYYRGDDVKLQVRASSGLVREYGMTGNESAFQNAIAALNNAIEGFKNQDTSRLQKAERLTDEAAKLLNEARAKAEGDKLSLEDTNTFNKAVQTRLTKFVSDRLAADVVGLSTELANSNNILIASFKAFGVISKTNLVNYL